MRHILSATVFTFSCFAQIIANRASIGGVVSDPAGAPIPQAQVIAVNQATSLERETVTNEAGVYRLDGMDPGLYSIRVNSSGMSVSVDQVSASIGGQVRVNVTMSLAATAETVDLSGTVAPVTESGSTSIFNSDQIQGLPTDGRRFQDFATLAPAVLAVPESRGQLSIAGQRGIYSNVMLDGADYNEPFLGGIRGGDRSTLAFTIPQSAIQEFQVVSSGYSAEYGRSTGGVLNVLTHSGANDFHGEAFYHIRDSSLGALDPLGLQSLERQHQFGGGIGGPIAKEKLFFFAAAEEQLAAYPRRIRYPALDALANQVTADIRPAYDYFRSLERDFEQTNDATAVFGRLDYQSASGSRLTGRYQHSRNTAANAVTMGTSLQPQTNQSFATNGNDAGYIHTAGGQWTAVLPRSVVNDLRVQYSREESHRTPNAIGPLVDAGVIGSFGTHTSLPGYLRDYRFQVANGVSFLSGRHSTAFGFDYSHIGIRQNAGANQFGVFQISSADPRRILQVLSGVAGNRFDDPSVVYRRQVGSLSFASAAKQAAFFVQDTWRLAPSFALTYGIRWEGQFNPQPIADNPFLLENVRDFRFPIPHGDPTVIRNPLDQWAPRLSFAWDVLGAGRTIVRGQTGLYYGQTPLFWFAGPLDHLSNAPSDLTLQIAPSGANTVYRQFQAAGFDLNAGGLGELPVFSISDIWMKVAGRPNPFAKANILTTGGENFHNPRSFQAGLSVEQRLANAFTVEYQWRHLNTVHLERNAAINMPVPFVRPGDLSMRPFFGLRSGVPRPNANLGWVIMRDSSARSVFDGHTIGANYRTRRLLFSGHYTLSFNKSDDDNERELTGQTFQNPFDYSREYNWSSLDARHQAAASVVWRAPGGFEIGSLFRARSGLPIDATTGGDTSELLRPNNLGNRPLERPGVVMLRNAFRNRGFRTVDVRVAKSFAVQEGMRLQLYADLFNVLNLDNVAFLPSTLMPNNPAFIYGPGLLTNGQMAPVDPRFLRIRDASGAYDRAVAAQQGVPFQAQLGLRLLF
jgi:hypothetical protein